MGDILAYVWKYSYLLEDKNPTGFGRWCSGKGIDLIGATVKRKKIDTEVTVSVRSLYVLKEKYIGKVLNFYLLICIHLIIKYVVANVVKFIVEQLPLYQQTIQSFKNDGYSVIGYARKSKTKESDETRSDLLNIMCKKLRMRSMVDKVFVSFKTSSNDPIMGRDLADNKLLEKLDADGNTQGKNAMKGSSLRPPLMLKFPDMLRYVSTKKTCLVMLTFAGLTTNTSDFETFLKM